MSFFADGLQERPQLTLAPVYDMLPMEAAPRAGVLPALQPTRPRVAAIHLDVWDDATRLAGHFWQRVGEDRRVSPAFRRAALARLRARP